MKRNGKASPRKDMNHHQLRGLITGTRQASKNNIERMILVYKKIRFVYLRSLVDMLDTNYTD